MVSYKYSKACVKQPLSKRPHLVFDTNYHLMQVKSKSECSKGSILQYFGPSLSYHLLLRSLIFEWSFYTGFTLAVFSEKTVFPNQSMMAISMIKLAFNMNKGKVKKN